MPATKTSARKTVRTTQPQFLGTSHVRHTGSIIMTLAVELPSSSGTSYVHTLRSWSRVGQPRCGRGRMRAAAALDVLLKAEPEWREGFKTCCETSVHRLCDQAWQFKEELS